MYNEIVDALTGKLAELFPECPVHTDTVEQGLEEPCFIVNMLEPSEERVMGQRYFRKTGFCVQYLPGKAAQVSRELNRVAEILMEGLEYITQEDGKLLRGSGRSFRTVEGMLLFNVSYNMYVLREREKAETMGHLSIMTRE